MREIKRPILESVAQKVAETAFSAKIDPRIQAARRIARQMGISEEEVLRKAREYLPHALIAPTLGRKIGKDIQKAYRKRRKEKRRGRKRSKRKRR